VDKFGGRNSFLVSMLLVAFFGALGAFAPTLGILTVLYSANRLTGSASWGAMVKQVPEWYGPTKLAFALGVLSLSFVFGGAIAVSIAGVIARQSHDNWHSIMGLPSVLLVLIAVLCWGILPRGSQAKDVTLQATHDRLLAKSKLRELFFDPQFHIICALSFTLTFLRETFNFWTVDFVKTEVGHQITSGSAAFMSTPFDVLGGAGILWLGWIYTRIGYGTRMRLLFGNLFLLAVLLYFLPDFFHWGSGLIMIAIGAIGFLVYGPYSLLAGVLSVEVRGKESAATVSGWVDGVGYFAGVLSGSFFGHLLERGGYRLGFEFMAVLCLISAVLCLFLYPKSKFSDAKC
jgi:MFS transporter, OPA family, glycerol-3-phosphate transporter